MTGEAAWVVVGCGYTGVRLARRLDAEGAAVVATRRSDEGLAALREALGDRVLLRVADLGRPETLAGLFAAGSVVVLAAPPSGEGGEEALVGACAAASVRRLVYVSSTGVYPPAGGAWVDEESPAAPRSEHGRRRLEAERAILATAGELGLEAVALRVAGIYGPGRGAHVRIRQGTYRVLGAGDSAVSRIHVDDLVSAILLAGRAEPLPRPIYTVADDRPTGARELADWVAGELGLPPPPSIDPSEASPRARAMLAADRRIANRRLKEELGLVLAYPTYREGIAQALAEERG